MLALAAARLGYKCHIFDPHERPAPPRSRPASPAPPLTMRRRCAFAAAVRRRHLRIRESAGRAAGGARRQASPGTQRSPWRRTARSRSDSSRRGACGRAVARVDSLADVAARRRARLPIVLKTRRYGYDGKGQAWVRDRPEAEAAGRRSAGSRRGRGGDRASKPNLASSGARWATGGVLESAATFMTRASCAARPFRRREIDAMSRKRDRAPRRSPRRSAMSEC